MAKAPRHPKEKKQNEPSTLPYIRTIGGENFLVIFDGRKPLASENKCGTSLQWSGLLKRETEAENE